MEISLEKNFFAGYITRDKVKWESVCKDELKTDYMHTDRGGQKNHEQQGFSKWFLDDDAVKNHSWKLWISPDFHKIRMKKKTATISQVI